MSAWAIDLGTTHTRVARWDDDTAQPRLVELPAICRRPGAENPLEAPRLVPSATLVLEHPGILARIGAWGPLARRVFLGRQALIGRPAVEHEEGVPRPSYAPSFKLELESQPLRPLVRVGTRAYGARDVARMFVRELLAEIRRETGERIRSVSLTTPVEAFETYRAELLRIAKHCGIGTVRFIDEPVAAALGYGLSIAQERLVLVADIGGGTMHLALVALGVRDRDNGRARVIAKEGRRLGGRMVDRWLLEEFCRRAGWTLTADARDEHTRYWYGVMLAEACRVKEALFFKPTTSFHLQPPVHMRRLGPDADAPLPLEVGQDDLVAVLARGGFLSQLDACLEGVAAQAARSGIRLDDVADVVMVGGSTLLPGVYARFEERFGRARVRAWQPFEAVAFGACAFAADRVTHADFIVHDYAFVTYDLQTRDREYTVIVPRGTAFPTPRDFWKRQLVPTCSLGEPERTFKLLICEIGHAATNGQRLVWDAGGTVHRLGEQPASPAPSLVVVPLNEANPTLGYLDPPHSPRDRRPRLEIAFGVNEERWLCATVIDLLTRKTLLEEASVVRLL